MLSRICLALAALLGVSPAAAQQCPTGSYIAPDGRCVTQCPPNTIPSDGRCVVLTTNITYIPPRNNTNITSCPYTYNGTCLKPCGPDQWYWNNTCVLACRPGEFLDMTGRCMSAIEMCRREMPGAIFNATTYQCECPTGSWITRNPNATDLTKPIMCAPVSADIKPVPRINCRSFIPYTIYDLTFETCVCDANHPIVIANPKDPFVPYGCAITGTPTTIKQCLPPAYFDFIEGGCMNGINVTVTIITPYNTSSTKTDVATAMPSRRPTTTPTPTRTAKPSDIPNSATTTPSASRTPKPSARIYADISRPPLPTVAVRPPPPAAALSPAPSPWAKKVNLTLEAADRPSYIDARMTMAGGNVTALAKPEKIQQLQASLACALRMPLENIRIRNITVTDAAGSVKRVDVDPSQFMMAGDGSTNCYDLRNVSAAARRLRALGASSGSGSVSVDYAIVEPSDEILALDTTQFNEVVSTSPTLLDVAASVGSTGVTAAAVETNMVTVPVPSAVTSPSAGASVSPQNYDIRYYIGGGIGGLMVFAGLVTALIFMYNENRRTKRLLRDERTRKMAAPPVTENPRVVVVFSGEPQTVNPMNRAGAMCAESTRLDYGPEAARRSAAGPLCQTHGTVV